MTARVFAIVPAAGRSRRMGSAKQLLDVGGRTMLDAVLEPLAAAQVAGTVVVTHTDLMERLDLSRFSNVIPTRNDDVSSEMIDSIRIGLRTWRERVQVAECDGFLICPADQPGITRGDFDRCIAAFRAAPERIVVAAHAGRRGHPILFPAALVPFVESADCDCGLHALPRGHAERVTLVACGSPSVCRDIDTRADYDSLR